MIYVCAAGCEKEVGMSGKHPGICRRHELPFYYLAGLKRTTPLQRTSEKRKPQARKQGSTLKRGRGFAVAPPQREKVRGLPCVGCGKEASDYVAIDPAHLWPQGQGGCDDPLCVIPLCRHFEGGCHRLYDEGRLDLLAKLIDRGYFAELAHAIEAHQLSPLTLLEHTTGMEWGPVNKAAA